MAIKIECYRLITSVRTARQYFPNEYEEIQCLNDGIICSPIGAMNQSDINSIIQECEKSGLRRFRQENTENIIGNYYIGTENGLDNTYQYKNKTWIRVHNGVAWNPYSPYGKNLPKKFPCFYGGFYYESKQIWEEAKIALSCFNDILDRHDLKRQTTKGKNLLSEIISSIPNKTPYDNFFYELSRKTFEHELTI